MLYALLCYNSEAVVTGWPREKDEAVMAHHASVIAPLARQRKLGPIARLMPTTTAVTVRAGRETLVLDGPFAETREQLLGFFVLDCSTLDDAIEAARQLTTEPGAIEIRPVQYYRPPGERA